MNIQVEQEKIVFRNKKLVNVVLMQSILYTLSLILIYLFQIIGAVILVTLPENGVKWIVIQRKLVLIFQPVSESY